MRTSKEMGYRIFTGKSEAHKAFNSLRGIVEGIWLDKVVNQKEIDELDKWCDEHHFLLNRNPFCDLITNIQVIINDNTVTEEEIEDMKWLCDKFKDGFEYYDDYTSDLQVLHGICHGLLADGVIREKEVVALKEWLNSHEHLSTFYPYDEIMSLVTDVLADGVVDGDERELLKAYFKEFVKLSNTEMQKRIEEETKSVKISGICAVAPDIRFIDNQFCFTGNSNKSSRNEIAGIIQEFGGKYVNVVSGNTNFLLVGDGGNPCWSYSCYGRKVEKAINLRKKGMPLLIVHENDFWDEVENRK